MGGIGWRILGKTSFASVVAIVFIFLELFFRAQNWALLQETPSLLSLLSQQATTTLVGLGMIAAALLVTKRRAGRLLLAVVLTAYGLYLCLNHLFYGFFFNNFTPFAVEGADTPLRLLKDSIRSEVGPGFFIGLALVLGVGTVLVWSAWRNLKAYPRRGTVVAIAATGLGSLLLSFVTSGGPHLQNLERNPLVDLFRQGESSPRVASETFAAGETLALRFGRVDAFPIAQVSNLRAKRRAGKPHVLYVLMESVGAVNILDGKNGIDGEVAPFLKSIAQRGILFPRIYNTFPGTTRSHVPIMTGGYTFTWGSIDYLFKKTILTETFPSVFNQAGYETALFSSQFLDFEQLNAFYKNLPFRHHLFPDAKLQNYQPAAVMNSWGLEEEATVKQIQTWMEERASNAPVFIEYITVATHHPYSVSKRFANGKAPESDAERYRNALRYSDQQIGTLVESLRLVLGNDLILVVSGDHGQAFGDRHPGNKFHKNHLYEENIRNFLLLVDFRFEDRGFVVPSIGAVSDILPTVASYVLAKDPKVPGQDLLRETYQPKLAFFHKNALPQKIGMVDGHWKYIADLADDAHAELYDLSKDPLEQKNLAKTLADQVAVYRDLCERWYVSTERRFLEEAIGHDQPRSKDKTIAELAKAGPKILAFGRAPDGAFQPLTHIHPNEKLVAWTHGPAFGRDTPVIYEWISPSGVVQRKTYTVKADWESVQVKFKQLPMEEGRWQLRITLEDGELLIAGAFEVTSQSP
jgi:arylsulfatase A-like enzyme